jgi:hypothetical protein
MGTSDKLLNEQNSKAIALFNEPEQQDRIWRHNVFLIAHFPFIHTPRKGILYFLLYISE